MTGTHNYSVGPLAFFAGALVGAGIGLLLAPYSGEESRSRLREYAGRATDDLIERGREAKATFETAFETAVERGRESFDSAKERGKQGYEAGIGAARDGGR